MRQIFSRKQAGQNIIEYALLITLILGGIMVMGPYVIRGWNAVMQGFDDSIQDSQNEPLDPAPPTGSIITGCECTYQPPCDTPPCCGMGGCEMTENALVAFCSPLGCQPGPTEPQCLEPNCATNCTANDLCCGPPVPGIAPDECGAGTCAPEEIRAAVYCGSDTTPTRYECLPSNDCLNQCTDGNLPIDWDASFALQPDFYHGWCPEDDINLSQDTIYQTVNYNGCSPQGNPKCEIRCTRGMEPAFDNTICECPCTEATLGCWNWIQTNYTYINNASECSSWGSAGTNWNPQPPCNPANNGVRSVEGCPSGSRNVFMREWVCRDMCARGGGNAALCSGGIIYPATGPQADLYSGTGCGDCPFGVAQRCDSVNPGLCDFWCRADLRWNGAYTWNTTAGGGWRCPGDQNLTDSSTGCIDEPPTTFNEKPFCSGGHLLPSGDFNWAMRAVEGGLCELDCPANSWLRGSCPAGYVDDAGCPGGQVKDCCSFAPLNAGCYVDTYRCDQAIRNNCSHTCDSTSTGGAYCPSGSWPDKTVFSVGDERCTGGCDANGNFCFSNPPDWIVYWSGNGTCEEGPNTSTCTITGAGSYTMTATVTFLPTNETIAYLVTGSNSGDFLCGTDCL